MAIDRDALLGWPFPDVVQSYSERDTMLYALGVGLGADPLDSAQLGFVYEEGLRTLPTMSLILGYPGFWLSDPRAGADWKRLLHGEQAVELLRPLPPSGTVVGRTKVVDVIDKGRGKGALVYSTREISDAGSGAVYARQQSTTFLRGDGGFGGPPGPVRAVHALPERAPDRAVTMRTVPQAALIYRLSGDYNPLHADPAVARAGGFERPILHGMCTFGVAGYALVAGAAGGDPERVLSVAARFTAPVYPGETIVTELWTGEGEWVSFRSRVAERDVVVLSNGRARVAAAAGAVDGKGVP